MREEREAEEDLFFFALFAVLRVLRVNRPTFCLRR